MSNLTDLLGQIVTEKVQAVKDWLDKNLTEGQQDQILDLLISAGEEVKEQDAEYEKDHQEEASNE